MKKVVKIGEAAKILGVSIDTLRRWEAKGKVETVRTPGGTRLYPVEALERYVTKTSQKSLKPGRNRIQPGPKPLLSKETLPPQPQAKPELPDFVNQTQIVSTGNLLDQKRDNEQFQTLEGFLAQEEGLAVKETKPLVPSRENPFKAPELIPGEPHGWYRENVQLEESTSKDYTADLNQITLGYPISIDFPKKGMYAKIYAFSKLMSSIPFNIRVVKTSFLSILLISLIAIGLLVSAYLYNPVKTNEFFQVKRTTGSPIDFLHQAVVFLLSPFNQLVQSGYIALAPEEARQLGFLHSPEDEIVSVLAASSIAQSSEYLEINADTNITNNLQVEGEGVFIGNITAPNIIYDLVAGANVTISEGQIPTISVAVNETLATVTARGGTTTTPLFLNGGVTLGNILNLGSLTSDPSIASNGQTYYNSTTNVFRCYQNGTWKNCDTSGGSGTVTSVGTGNGLAGGPITDSGTISVNLKTSGTTATTDSNSGLEVSGSGLSLLSGCTNSQILRWNSGTSVWECTTLASGFGGFNITGSAGVSQPVASGDTITIAAGNGISTIASVGPTVTVGLNLTAAGTASSATISSGSGLETSATGLTLLRGCNDTFVLKWDNAAGTWGCAQDIGGLSSAIIGVQEESVAVGTNITTLNFRGADFNVATGAANTDDVSVDYTNFGTRLSTLHIGDGTSSQTVDIGGVSNSNASTINIATSGTAADTISVGNTNASTSLSLSGGTVTTTLNTTGSALFSSSTAGADSIAINPQSSTTTNAFTGTLTSADLTAARTWTFPDSTGTICTTATCLTSSSGVASVTGTANQITASPTTGAVILTLPAAITTPGSLTTTTTLTATTDFNVNGNTTLGDTASDGVTVTGEVLGASPLNFEGATNDNIYTTFAITDPSLARTITFPNASGTVAVSATGPITLSAAGDIGCSTCLTSATGVTSVTGTANQITASPTTGAVILTLPAAITTPGSLTTTTTLTSGTDFNVNGNTTIGNATTDRLTVTSQLLGASPLVFQGATDNAFTTTLAFTDPTTPSKTITFPDATGTVAVSATGPITLSAAGDIGCTTCVLSGGAGASKWTDGGAITYLTATADDLAVGASNTLVAPFSIDVSANLVRIGTGATANAQLDMFASDGDTGSLIYTTSDQFHLTGGDLLLTPASVAALTLNQFSTTAGETAELRFMEGGGSSTQYVGFKAPDTLTTNKTYVLPHHDTTPPADNMVLTWNTGDQLEWQSVAGIGAGGDITDVGDVTSGAAFNGTQGTTLFFEGATADGNEIALTTGDPGADFTVTIPSITGTLASLAGTQTFTGDKTFSGIFSTTGDTTLGDAAADLLTVNATLQGASPLVFEGASADAFETTFAITDPTVSDKTITFPNATGTVAVSATAPVTLSALGDIGCSTCLTSATGVASVTGTANQITASPTTGAVILSLPAAITAPGSLTTTTTLTAGTDLAVNGNTTIGDATTDRLTVTSQLLGASPLVFQGATDNSFTTTFAITDPTTPSKTITFPNATGTVAVSATGPITLSALGDIGCSTCLTSASGVTSVTGTANQITASPTTGAVILTLPSAITTPGSLTTTTFLTATTDLTVNGNTTLGDSNTVDTFTGNLLTSAFTSGATTQTALALTAASITNGEAFDITSTLAPSDAGTHQAIDINITHTPTSSADTFAGMDLAVTEGANALANTLYGAKVTTSNAANTSTGTHTIYGGHFTATGKTAGTTTAVGLYATATGADNNYAGIFEAGNVGIGTTTPIAPLSIQTTASTAIRVDSDGANSGAQLFAYGSAAFPFLSGRQASGTLALPTASANGAILMRFGGGGYTGSAFTPNNRASVDFIAAETWNTTNNGTYITLSTTPLTSTTLTERVRIDSTGFLGIATTTPRTPFDVLSTAGAQARLTYTDNSVYTSLTTNSSGNLSITTTGTGGATFTTTTANGDSIAIQPQTSTATNSFTGTLTSADLTAARTWTFPDSTGTICTTATCLTSSSGVSSVTGTANQITASPTTGAVILTLPAAITAPGSLTTTTTLTATTDFNVNGNTTIGNATTDRLTVTSQVLGGSPLVFQGATDNSFTTTLAFTDPTTPSKTITFPNATGTVAVSATSPVTLSALGDIGCATCLTSTSGVTTATGTVAQILVNGDTAAHSGAITLSLPSLITTPGALEVASSLQVFGISILGTAATDSITVNGALLGVSPLKLEGSTHDGVYTTFSVTDPTQARTITFPNATGTVCVSGQACALTGTVTSTGTPLANRIAYFTTDSNITGSADLTFNPATTTGTTVAMTNTALTTGELLDLTSTSAPADGSTNEAIDINITHTPTSSADTFAGMDLAVTEGANALANTLYGAKVTTSNAANTSTGTHTIYGGHFTATGKTAGTTTAVGLYATATGADSNYAGIFEAGNVGIGTTTPTAVLAVQKDWPSSSATNLMETLDAYGDNSRFVMRRANGTAASPTQVLSADILGNFNFRGFHSGGAFATAGLAAVTAIAAENFTSSAMGTYMTFAVTPIGSITQAERVRIDTTGFVGIATTTPRTQLDVLSTAGAQARLTYTDNSVYTSLSTNSSGNLSINTTGTGGTTFTTTTANGDSIAIQPQTSTATNSFTGTLTSADLTAARTWTLPDATGTVCVSGQACALTGTVTSTGSSLANRLAYFTTDSNITGDSAFAITATAGSKGVTIASDITTSASGTGLSLTAASLTTGIAESITAGGSTGMTTGNALLITGPTGAAALSGAAGGVVNLTAAGNFTSSGNVGLLNLYANSTTAGVVSNIEVDALTTGTGLRIGSTGTGLTSGSLLAVTSATTGAVATNGIVSLTATGAYTSTSNAGLLTLTANSTLTGTIQSIFGNGLTTGTALNISTNSNALTGAASVGTGSLLNILRTGTTLTAGSNSFTGSLVNIGYNPTFTVNGGTNIDTGNIVTITRDATATGAGVGYSRRGAVVSIEENCTSTSSGTCFSNANNQVLLLTESDVNANGNVLKIANTSSNTAFLVTNGSAGGGTAVQIGDLVASSRYPTGSTVSLVGLYNNFNGAGVTAYGFNMDSTDTTANANTDYGSFITFALSGNANKVAKTYYSTISSSSTTGESAANGGGIVNYEAVQSLTGALSATTRNASGFRSLPASTANSTGGTLNLYGSYNAPSSTGAGATSGTPTTNVFGQFVSSTATHGGDRGTVNNYGVYIANGVSSTNGTSAKYGLFIEDQATASLADTNFAIFSDGGQVAFALPGTQTGNAVCHTSANTTTTADNIVDCTGTLSDYAERYPVASDIGYGEIVTSSNNYKTDKSGVNVPEMVRSNQTYQNIIGVTSNNYSDFSSIGDNYDSSVNTKPVALSGRVPVKVTLENGPIHEGDFLTSSTTPGAAMKATHPGQVIGTALGDFNGGGGGTVLVFIKTGYADPDNLLANLRLGDDGTLLTSKLSTNELVLSGEGARLVVNGTGIDASSLIQAGEFASNISKLENQYQTLADSITNINNTQASQSAQIAQVEQITDVLGDKVASQSAQIADVNQRINDLKNQLSASESASTSASLAALKEEVAKMSAAPSNSSLMPVDPLLATESATLGSLKVNDMISTLNFETIDATVSGTFKSLGETFLGNTTIAGDLSVDGTFSINNGNSINSLPTLFLQNGPLAELVDFFNGLVTIDKTGKVAAQEIQTKKVVVTSTTPTGSTFDPTIGSDKILAGHTEIAVFNNQVTQNSKIFVTPRNQTGGQALIVTGVVDGSGFVVGLDHTFTKDIDFDWWIVETR